MHMRVDEARHESSAFGIKNYHVGIGGEIATVLGNFNDLVLFDPERGSGSQFPSLGIQEFCVFDYQVRHRRFLRLWPDQEA
jgi:hypothetical protein